MSEQIQNVSDKVIDGILKEFNEVYTYGFEAFLVAENKNKPAFIKALTDLVRGKGEFLLDCGRIHRMPVQTEQRIEKVDLTNCDEHERGVLNEAARILDKKRKREAEPGSLH